MRKLWFILFLLSGALLLPAEVGMLSVSDEAKHTVKEDFNHTFEYLALPTSPGKYPGGKCQATRIGRRWFVTAAHCVQRICEKECRIQMDLLDQSISAFAEVKHTPERPAVFIHPGFDYNVFVKNDVALIRLDLDKTPFTYYQRLPDYRKKWLTQKQADEYFAKTPAARSALYKVRSPSFPPILVFNSWANYVFKGKISVISIFNGERVIKPDPYPVHYVKRLEYAYTNNFGVRRGMSGSGVMSNTGEFIGVISGIFQVSKKNEKNKEYEVEDELFMFFVFNKSAIDFMKDVMGSDFYKLDLKNAYPDFVKKSNRNYTQIINRVRKVHRAL